MTDELEDRLSARRTPNDWWHWLYERAEDAATGGLPLESALTAVRAGYSSIDADRMVREDP